ncbi:MAG: hypothetical protein J2P55_00075 [Rhizobiales bacterium]|nr:hypothetical protein [Hyphomicrobiales bacterium]
MKSGPTKAEKEALRILAGCERGATEAALAANGIKRATLDNLVRAGLIATRVADMAHPKIKVTWFYIPNPED